MTETVEPAANGARANSGRRLNALAAIAIFGALVALAGVVIVPILATALGGFKELGELRSNLLGLPHVWVWSNYWDIVSGARYWQVLGNSLIMALLTVALTLALASMAAFTFAHLKFFGGSFCWAICSSGCCSPPRPRSCRCSSRSAILACSTPIWGVVLPQVAFSLAMAVLLLRNAFKQLPDELLDAAMMDGCGYFRYFLFITLPLSGPILSTVAVISFVGSWNGYLLPLVVLNSESRYPWTLGLMAYQGQYNTSWQLVLAFITLTILPAILMFLLAQRYIVAGLTAGAVKA